MKEIFNEVLRAMNDPAGAALATVVATEGTAPRKEGAKMLVVGGKTLKGEVTIGGCVDARVIQASEEVARSGVPRMLRMQLGEEDAFEIGLTCAGALRVLVEPVRMEEGICAKMKDLLDRGIPFASLTVTQSSLPSVKTGAKAIVAPQREAVGSLGNEKLHEVTFSLAQDLLDKGISRVLDLDENLNPVEEYGNASVEVFVDIIGYSPDLFIFGAGQVAVPVARLANEVGFRVHVIDTRPLFANQERFPQASEIAVGFPAEIAQERTFNQFSFALLLTHAAKHDLPVLEVLLRSDVRYIGVLGSSRRAAALAHKLKEAGFKEGALSRVHIPVGLDVGAESTEQMAVAIVGELLMVRTASTGKSMKLVKGFAASS